MEKLLFGLATTAIGMVVVFAGLYILIICINIMHSLAARNTGKKDEPSQETPDAVVENAADDAQIAPENDDSLIAAITAAISCMSEDKQTGFIVRRVRRIQNSTAFARAARDEQLYNHL